MTLIMMDGFDHGATFSKYLATPSGASIGTGTPIADHGAYAVINQLNQAAKFAIPAALQHDTITVGGYVYRGITAANDDGLDANGGIFRLCGDSGATIHVTIAEDVATGTLRVRRGPSNGTILGSTVPALMMVATWVHIAIKVTLHDTAGTVDVWVNGANVLSLTGLDTRNAGTAPVFDLVEFHGTANGNQARAFDDVYVTNGAGPAPNNGYLGVCRVNTLLPNVDGAVEQWGYSAGTDSYVLIDEAAPNSDTDYIQSDVAAAVTRVGLADLTDLGNDIHGVLVGTHARKDDAGAASFRSGVHSGGSNANGADKVLSETYGFYWDVIERNPNGNIPWTPAAVNAAEAFVEVR